MGNILGGKAAMVAMGVVGLTAVLKLSRKMSVRVDGKMAVLDALARAILAGVVTPFRPKPPTPTTLADVSPLWLSDVLRDEGALAPGTTVTSCEAKAFMTGKTSYNARLTLEYSVEGTSSAPPGTNPRTLVLKLSRRDVKGRVLNNLLKLYREAEFYKLLAGEVPLRTVRVYSAHRDWITNDFLMLMEDFGDAEMLIPFQSANVYNEEEGAAATEVQSVLLQVAAMHGKFWRSPLLLQPRYVEAFTHHGLYESGGRDLKSASEIIELVGSAWPKTKAIVKAGGTKDVKWPSTPWPEEFISMMNKSLRAVINLPAYRDGVLRGDWTLVHGDFHAQNVLVRKASTGTEHCVLDWQIVHIGEGMRDVGQMIVGSMSVAAREAHEEALVRAYWREFIAQPNAPSAEEYPFAKAWLRYKFWGAVCWMAILAVLGELGVNNDDSQFVEALYHKVSSFVNKHGSPAVNYAEFEMRWPLPK